VATSRKASGPTFDRNPRTQAGELEATNMDDLKAGAREVKDDAKKALREADGKEDLGDKVGNLGDDIRRNAGNAGDKVDDEIDKDRTTDQPRGV
jgi:hypothetical protein